MKLAIDEDIILFLNVLLNPGFSGNVADSVIKQV